MNVPTDSAQDTCPVRVACTAVFVMSSSHTHAHSATSHTHTQRHHTHPHTAPPHTPAHSATTHTYTQRHHTHTHTAPPHTHTLGAHRHTAPPHKSFHTGTRTAPHTHTHTHTHTTHTLISTDYAITSAHKIRTTPTPTDHTITHTRTHHTHTHTCLLQPRPQTPTYFAWRRTRRLWSSTRNPGYSWYSAPRTPPQRCSTRSKLHRNRIGRRHTRCPHCWWPIASACWPASVLWVERVRFAVWLTSMFVYGPHMSA